MTQDKTTVTGDQASAGQSATSDKPVHTDETVAQAIEKAVSDYASKSGRTEKALQEREANAIAAERSAAEALERANEERDRRERDAVAGDAEALKEVQSKQAVRTREEKVIAEEKRLSQERVKVAEGLARIEGVEAKQSALALVAKPEYANVSPDLLVGMTENVPADKRAAKMEELAQAISGKVASSITDPVKRQTQPDGGGGGGGGGAGRTITRGEYKAMSPTEAAQFSKDGGSVDWGK